MLPNFLLERLWQYTFTPEVHMEFIAPYLDLDITIFACVFVCYVLFVNLIGPKWHFITDLISLLFLLRETSCFCFWFSNGKSFCIKKYTIQSILLYSFERYPYLYLPFQWLL